MNNELPTTLAEANAIWHACYIGLDWNSFTTEQREAAIRIRSGQDSDSGFGVWNISDRD